jgi:purine nucleosidase
VPAEFNVGFDPEAAHIVFEGFPDFDLVDWELTLRHAFEEADFDEWLAEGDRRAAFFGRVFQVARETNRRSGRRGIIAADALAMAVAIDPSVVVRSERRHVGVELDGRLTRGATVVDWNNRLKLPARANVVLELDQAKFAGMVRRALGA